MNIKQSLLYGLMFGVLSLAGCGGGGDAAQPTTATLKLSTVGTLSPGTTLSGIGVSIVLPAGVTVATDANGAVSSGVVTVSGVAAPGTVLAPSYTPASGGNPATLTFAMVSNVSAGFGIGEFATLTCNRASGVTPQVTDFSVTLNPIDAQTYVPVTGLTPSIAVTLN
jgi:hypothetical protein